MKIMELQRWVLVAMLLLLCTWVFYVECNDNEKIVMQKADQPHSRQKRLIWVTTDGRLALPPGTELTITPSLSLPFIRYPPEGFLSNMSISLPFTIIFDQLGLTDNQNPFGGQFLGKSKARRTGKTLTDYVGQWMEGQRLTRSTSQQKSIHKYFHGGERALLYTVIEDILANFGMNGKACLLRVICEVHGHQAMHKFGVIGEFLHLFLTASKSPYVDFLEDYVNAETAGKESKECYPYFKQCPRSLFLSSYSYSKTDSSAEYENESAPADGVMDADDSSKPVDSSPFANNTDNQTTMAMAM